MEPLWRESAPGKLILMGEHAVVYGEPGLAIPLSQLRASVSFYPAESPRLEAPDLDLFLDSADLITSEHPLALTLQRACYYFSVHYQTPTHLPALCYQIQSDIPVKRGMGSGTAISCAIFKAFAAYYQCKVSLDEVQSFAQQMDQVYHGQPSGIDAAVIAHERPLRFQRLLAHGGEPPQITFLALCPFSLLIADTGPARPTAEAVALVAQAYQKDPKAAVMIRRIGELVKAAEAALMAGDMTSLGALLYENHQCLQALGVSTPALDYLVAGAQVLRSQGVVAGAKLSGAGLGGVCFALLYPPEALHREQLISCWAPTAQHIYL